MVMALLSDARSGAAGLRDDNRGAVMLTGLFMAFFLVGALWYVIGIGDTIIFRDRMQEATDSAVFSSAAVHAKGMNFISICNIILLCCAVVHIVAGIAQDLTILACLSFILSIQACPRVPTMVRAFHKVSAGAKKVMTATSNTASAIAIATPLAGTARGMAIAKEYGNQGRVGNVWSVAVSPSFGAMGGKGILFGKQRRVGLPVDGQPYSMLCERIGATLGEKFNGNLFPFPYPDKFKELFSGAMGKFFVLRYCNAMNVGAVTDAVVGGVKKQLKKVKKELETGEIQTTQRNNEGGDKNGQLGLVGIQDYMGVKDYNPSEEGFNEEENGGSRNDEPVNGWKKWFDPGFDRGWDDPGVLTVVPDAGNGTFAQQVWAVTVNPQYVETNERRVSIAGSIGKDGSPVASDSKKGSSFVGFFAQAEFYYDCDKEWDDEECGGDDNASFGIKWRARLRHLEWPNLLNVLARIANGAITKQIDKVVSAKINSLPVVEALNRSAIGAITVDSFSGWIQGQVSEYVTDLVTGAVSDVANALGPGAVSGSYH